MDLEGREGMEERRWETEEGGGERLRSSGGASEQAMGNITI